MRGPGTSASFAYDALGRRQSLTLNGTTTSFLYDGLNIVQELQGGTPSANLLTGLSLDETFRRADSAGARDLLRDVLGSTVALADSAGAVQTSYTYQPFGASTPTGEASSNSLQYTGREQDASGLLYLRARYYGPSLQRFLSEDRFSQVALQLAWQADRSIRGLDSLQRQPELQNLYAYVANRPLTFRDPRGTCLATGAIGSAVGVLGALSSGGGWKEAAIGGVGGFAFGCGGFVLRPGVAALGGFLADLFGQKLACWWGGRKSCDINWSEAVGAGAATTLGSGFQSYVARQAVPAFTRSQASAIGAAAAAVPGWAAGTAGSAIGILTGW